MHTITDRLLRLGAASVAAAVATVGFASAATAQPSVESYVALGDSFVASPELSLEAVSDTCLRSDLNYPSLVADTLGVTDFTDASCAGAVSGNFDGSVPSRLGGTAVAPQYDALRPDTDLVTVGIGGNDIGLVELAVSCINIAPAPAPDAATCAKPADQDAVGASIDEFAPTYATIVEEIRERSPQARIVFVGYPTGIRDNGCFPTQQIWPEDATYLQAKIDQLNTVMEREVTAAGAEYLDLRPSTIEHDACAEPEIRWLEGIIPVTPALPLHPNVAGHHNAADQVLTALQN